MSCKMCDRLLTYMHTFALSSNKNLLSCISFFCGSLNAFPYLHRYLNKYFFYVIYFWTLSFNFVFMCPKNMLLLKSGKGDQICQICLDLHHLHTIHIHFPGEDPYMERFPLQLGVVLVLLNYQIILYVVGRICHGEYLLFSVNLWDDIAHKGDWF